MSTPEEYLHIDTPENVIFGYEIVGIGSRFLAALIDSFIVALIQIPPNVLLFYVLSANLDDGSAGLISAILTFVTFALLWGYYIFFEVWWNGSTPGKRAIRVRVIRQDGMPITLTESIIRNLIRLIDFLPLAYGLGVVTMFIDGKSRRLGDLAAGTLVVREQEDVTLSSLAKQTRPAASSLSNVEESEPRELRWPVHLLTEEDIRLAESFLERRASLATTSGLSRQIMDRLTARMEVPAIYGSREQLRAIQEIVNEYYAQS